MDTVGTAGDPPASVQPVTAVTLPPRPAPPPRPQPPAFPGRGSADPKRASAPLRTRRRTSTSSSSYRSSRAASPVTHRAVTHRAVTHRAVTHRAATRRPVPTSRSIASANARSLASEHGVAHVQHATQRGRERFEQSAPVVAVVAPGEHRADRREQRGADVREVPAAAASAPQTPLAPRRPRRRRRRRLARRHPRERRRRPRAVPAEPFHPRSPQHLRDRLHRLAVGRAARSPVRPRTIRARDDSKRRARRPPRNRRRRATRRTRRDPLSASRLMMFTASRHRWHLWRGRSRAERMGTTSARTAGVTAERMAHARRRTDGSSNDPRDKPVVRIDVAPRLVAIQSAHPIGRSIRAAKNRSLDSISARRAATVLAARCLPSKSEANSNAYDVRANASSSSS